MADIKLVQKEFFESLKDIQESIVYSTLSDYKEGNNVEDLLYDVTYKAIYRVMELIDGYANPALKLDLVDITSNKSLRSEIELHDTCANYLKTEV